MPIHRALLTACFAAAILLTVAVSARPEEGNKLTQKDLPAPVQAAFQKAYPNAVITNIESETEDSLACFGIEFKEGNVDRSVLYSADGILCDAEEQVAPDSLPPAVKAALDKHYPKYKINEASLTKHGSVTSYEVVVEKGKKGFELVIAPDGAIQKANKMSSDKEKNESGSKKIGKKDSGREKDEGDDNGDEKD